ncbi:hypothetical protein Trydic_g18494 [Trypoxylus dichotomus]
MDQSNTKLGLINGNVDINQVITTDGNEKKKVARRRWAILAKALKSPSGSEPSSPTDECSIRRISSFMLLKTQKLENVLQSIDTQAIDKIDKRTWYKYCMNIDEQEYFVVVGHKKRTFSAEDLMGFNNTGNICIWPSEETLTYYLVANLNLFHHKTVLELGGGMSCLAGLFCGKYASAKNVVLTDGNKISIENVEISMHLNKFTCPVSCQVFKWGETKSDVKFDVILSADCLFFDEARSALIDTIWDTLDINGIGLVMAPNRGNTLQNFIQQSENKGFKCREIKNYNNTVWERHLQLLENNDYDENIHYPILIELTKL